MNLDRRREVALGTRATGFDVGLLFADTIADHVPVDDRDSVARTGNDALDELQTVPFRDRLRACCSGLFVRKCA